MNIIGQLKNKTLQLRKEQNKKAQFAAYILSEVESIGKNNGNRETTDDEAVRYLRKFIDKNKKLLEDYKDPEAIAKILEENKLFEDLLPKMKSNEEISAFLDDYFGNEKPHKGEAMKAVKSEFGSKVDMKQVNKLISEKYGV